MKRYNRKYDNDTQMLFFDCTYLLRALSHKSNNQNKPCYMQVVTSISWTIINVNSCHQQLLEAPKLDTLFSAARIPLDTDVNSTGALLGLLIADLAREDLALLQGLRTLLGIVLGVVDEQDGLLPVCLGSMRPSGERNNSLLGHL